MWGSIELQQRCDDIEKAREAMQSLESLFSVTKPPPHVRRKKKSAAGVAGENTEQVGGILEARRAQNVCITLATMRTSVVAVVDAVVAADTDVLQPDIVQALLRCVPLQEEVDKLMAFAGDAQRLDEAEKFFLEVSKIPRYGVRLKCFATLQSFQSNTTRVVEQAASALPAFAVLYENNLLKAVLLRVLTFGNILNESTAMGSAAGFDVACLVELAKLQANAPGMSMLRFIFESCEELRGWLDVSFAALDCTDRLSLQAVAEAAGELRLQWQQARDVAAATPDSDPLKQKLEEFLAENVAEYDGASLQAKQCEAEAARLVQYFGCEKSMSAEDIVGVFRVFVRACKGAKDAIAAEAAAAALSSSPVTASTTVSRQTKLKVPAKTPIVTPQDPAAVKPQTNPSAPPDIFEIPVSEPDSFVIDVPDLISNSLNLDLPSLPVLPPMAAPDLFASQSGNAFVVNVFRDGFFLRHSLRVFYSPCRSMKQLQTRDFGCRSQFACLM